MTPISLTCSQCGARLRAPETAIGKSTHCPKCGTPLTVAVQQAPLPTAASRVSVSGGGAVLPELVIDRPASPDPTPSLARQRVVPVALVVAGIALIAGTFASFGWWSLRRARPNSTASASASPNTAASNPAAGILPGAAPQIAPRSSNDDETNHVSITSDRATLWQSPTAGKPLDLKWVPPGAQMLVALRPRELLSGPAASAVEPLTALVSNELDTRRPMAACDWNVIDEALVAYWGDEESQLQTSAVFRATPEVRRAVEELFQSLPTREIAGQTWHERDGWFYFFPADDPDTWVAVPERAPENILASTSVAPVLATELVQLLRTTDTARQLNIVALAGFVSAEGRTLLGGTLEPLRLALEQFLADDARAVAFSLHVGDDFFAELRVVPTGQTRRSELVPVFDRRWEQATREASRWILSDDPFGQQLRERWPRMLAAWYQTTRTNWDGPQFVMNSALPAQAAENLAWGLRLALAASRATGTPTPANTPTQPTAGTIAERLSRPISLVFPRNSLETALSLFQAESGCPLEILGADLGVEGITKNQSLLLEAHERPAREILREILQMASPDGKLVYTIHVDRAGGERLWITTRAAAERRGEVVNPGLPAELPTQPAP